MMFNWSINGPLYTKQISFALITSLGKVEAYLSIVAKSRPRGDLLKAHPTLTYSINFTMRRNLRSALCPNVKGRRHGDYSFIVEIGKSAFFLWLQLKKVPPPPRSLTPLMNNADVNRYIHLTIQQSERTMVCRNFALKNARGFWGRFHRISVIK